MDIDNGTDVGFAGTLAALVMMIPLWLFSRPLVETGGSINRIWVNYRRWLEDEVSQLRISLWLARIMVVQVALLSIAVFCSLGYYITIWVKGVWDDELGQSFGNYPMWLHVVVGFTSLYVASLLCIPVCCSSTAMSNAVRSRISAIKKEE